MGLPPALLCSFRDRECHQSFAAGGTTCQGLCHVPREPSVGLWQLSKTHFLHATDPAGTMSSSRIPTTPGTTNRRIHERSWTAAAVLLHTAFDANKGHHSSSSSCHPPPSQSTFVHRVSIQAWHCSSGKKQLRSLL